MSHFVHHVPGRLRVRLPAMPSAARAEGILAALGALDGTRSIEVNAKARSVIVHYDPQDITPETILDRLKAEGDLPLARPNASSNGFATAMGTAIGNALFGAVLRTGVERSVASLVGAGIR